MDKGKLVSDLQQHTPEAGTNHDAYNIYIYIHTYIHMYIYIYGGGQRVPQTGQNPGLSMG